MERIGQPYTIVVDISSSENRPLVYRLIGYKDGKEIESHDLNLAGELPGNPRITLERFPTEIALFTKPEAEKSYRELTRKTLRYPVFEAQALARPEIIVNPINLGTILTPGDWLLLGKDQKAVLDIAAIGYDRDMPIEVQAWFASAPLVKTATSLRLTKGRRIQFNLPAPPIPPIVDRDQLNVNIVQDNKGEIWRETIQTTIVRDIPDWPEFGATKTKLRYDAPISIRAEDGSLSSMDYENGWDARLHDVVVSLPNGSRFVFWRGASYIPFWVGRYNTGLCYEWAETQPPEGYTDCVEPLMDKELRYGRVRIIESTVSRVHVRWSYQSCDFHYKVWGDSAAEDYYFYPDGFGTRVLNLKSSGDTKYELSEFIILTPRATYPFSVLPSNLVDFLFMDGIKREILFPFFQSEQSEKLKTRDMPIVYRIRLNKKEKLSAIYFNPNDAFIPNIFAPFSDRNVTVTPTYWGNHWPLARGRTTGYAINDRVQFTPAHNSIMTWGFEKQPVPVQRAELETLDALGAPKWMKLRQWVWLIGMTDSDDRQLLKWAHSFSHPPELDVKGARLAIDSYAPERRALRLVVEDAAVTVKIKPKVPCVNPVFELLDAPNNIINATLNDRKLTDVDYRWDGRTLWLKADIDEPVVMRLQFADSP